MLQIPFELPAQFIALNPHCLPIAHQTLALLGFLFLLFVSWYCLVPVLYHSFRKNGDSKKIEEYSNIGLFLFFAAATCLFLGLYTVTLVPIIVLVLYIRDKRT